MKKIIFRADAGATIGFGHFIRTLALAEMLKDDFECRFATVLPTPFQKREVEKVCELIALPGGETHFEAFLSILKGDELVVLDNYFFLEPYQKSIKDRGCTLACIDDLHDRHFCADFIINHALGVTPNDYVGTHGAKYLLGFDYALLRKAYLEDFAPTPHKKYGCLIMMGGSDPLQLTLKVVNMLEELQFDQPIAVIVGDGFANDSSLMNKTNVTLFKGLPGNEVLERMKESRFGIFPASTTSIEACAARLPFICGHYVDNQINLYNGLKHHELALCIGSFEHLSKEVLSNALSVMNQDGKLDAFRANQIELLDKGSKKRFIETFKQV